MSYPKECVLNDCVEAVIRPLEEDDTDLLSRFFEAIPEDDRWCMRYDTSNPTVIKRWFEKDDQVKGFMQCQRGRHSGVPMHLAVHVLSIVHPVRWLIKQGFAVPKMFTNEFVLFFFEFVLFGQGVGLER